MLHAVLEAIEQANGPIALNDLSRQLHLDPGVLDGMIQFWVRKGRILQDGHAAASPHTGCGDGCHISQHGCPYVVRMPTMYELKVLGD